MNLKTILAVFGFAFSASIYAADVNELRVGMDPTYEPFEYKTPDGKLVGFEVDIANALCVELKKRCVFVESSWTGIIPSLLANKYDVILSSLGMTEERQKTIAFTNQYYRSPSRVIVKRGSGIDGSVASLKGKRIGVLKGSAQETYANKVYAKSGSTVVGYATTQDSYLDMTSGRLDALVANVLEVKPALLDKPEGKSFEFAGTDLIDPAVFAGVGGGLRKEDVKLKEELNAAIQTIQKNGTYSKIAAKYFDFDVSGK